MGWAVGWDSDHDRWMGYGVPAYCDAAAVCVVEINRGLDYRCDCEKHGDVDGPLDLPTVFVCRNHTCVDVDESNLPVEHPDWINHLLTDESWGQWRAENPQQVDRLREMGVTA